MFRRSLLIVLALSFALEGFGQPRLTIPGAKLREIFRDFDYPDSPGCAVGIIEEQELILARGFGQANLEYGIPIKADTVFRIGSTSKQFTAMAIQLLAQDGRLNLSDDIRKFLPEIPDYGDVIQVQHLIHHTSGLRDYLTLMRLAGLRNDDFYTDAQVLEMVSRQKELNFRPGDQFLYSNSGYFLLAEIVKRVSGQTLRDFASKRILEPLGMNSSHFHNDHQETVPFRASGYRRTRDGFEISMTTLDMIGDGGLFTTIEDLARWDGNFYTGRIGGSELIEDLQETATLNDGTPIEYASGLFVSQYRGLPTVRHGGAFVGFRAELLRFPGEQVSIACLCNLAQANPSQLANRVADVLLKDRFPASKAVSAEAGLDLTEIPAAQSTPWVGAWETEDGEIWRITQDQDQVLLQTGGRALRLLRSSSQPETWQAVDAPIALQILFESTRQGTVIAEPRRFRLTRIELIQPGESSLQGYTGRYHSPELGIAVEVSADGPGLKLRNLDSFRDSPAGLFIPTTRHRFDVGSTSIVFEPTSEGKMTSFRMSSGRVRNILFLRQELDTGTQ